MHVASHAARDRMPAEKASRMMDLIRTFRLESNDAFRERARERRTRNDGEKRRSMTQGAGM
jgi:hypothetical protein